MIESSLLTTGLSTDSLNTNWDNPRKDLPPHIIAGLEQSDDPCLLQALDRKQKSTSAAEVVLLISQAMGLPIVATARLLKKLKVGGKSLSAEQLADKVFIPEEILEQLSQLSSGMKSYYEYELAEADLLSDSAYLLAIEGFIGGILLGLFAGSNEEISNLALAIQTLLSPALHRVGSLAYESANGPRTMRDLLTVDLKALNKDHSLNIDALENKVALLLQAMVEEIHIFQQQAHVAWHERGVYLGFCLSEVIDRQLAGLLDAIILLIALKIGSSFLDKQQVVNTFLERFFQTRNKLQQLAAAKEREHAALGTTGLDGRFAELSTKRHHQTADVNTLQRLILESPQLFVPWVFKALGFDGRAALVLVLRIINMRQRLISESGNVERKRRDKREVLEELQSELARVLASPFGPLTPADLPHPEELRQVEDLPGNGISLSISQLAIPQRSDVEGLKAQAGQIEVAGDEVGNRLVTFKDFNLRASDERGGQLCLAMGPNGSGKSSLITTISGLKKGDPSQNQAELNGIDINQYDPESRRSKIIYLDGHPSASLRLTVVGILLRYQTRLNLSFDPQEKRGCRIVRAWMTGSNESRYQAEFQELENELMGVFAPLTPDTTFDNGWLDRSFSGAETAMLQFASHLLINEPIILIFDEPEQAMTLSTFSRFFAHLEERLQDSPLIAILSMNKFADVVAHSKRLAAVIRTDATDVHGVGFDSDQESRAAHVKQLIREQTEEKMHHKEYVDIDEARAYLSEKRRQHWQKFEAVATEHYPELAARLAEAHHLQTIEIEDIVVRHEQRTVTLSSGRTSNMASLTLSSDELFLPLLDEWFALAETHNLRHFFAKWSFRITTRPNTRETLDELVALLSIFEIFFTGVNDGITLKDITTTKFVPYLGITSGEQFFAEIIEDLQPTQLLLKLKNLIEALSSPTCDLTPENNHSPQLLIAFQLMDNMLSKCKYRTWTDYRFSKPMQKALRTRLEDHETRGLSYLTQALQVQVNNFADALQIFSQFVDDEWSSYFIVFRYHLTYVYRLRDYIISIFTNHVQTLEQWTSFRKELTRERYITRLGEHVSLWDCLVEEHAMLEIASASERRFDELKGQSRETS